MNYRGHIATGLLSVFVVAPMIVSFIQFRVMSSEFFLFLPCLLVGSLLPDIDHPESKISTWAQRILLIIGVVIFLFDVLYRGNPPGWKDVYFFTIVIPVASLILSRVIYYSVGHRTITHSIFFIAALALVAVILHKLEIFNGLYSVALVWGALFHIYIDSKTPKGVAFFFPVSKLFYHSLLVVPRMPALTLLLRWLVDLVIVAFAVYSIVYFFRHGFVFLNITNLFPLQR